ncbi:MAG TPA: PKD domain-containing protein [Chitinophagaceae bacterium]|nr:PKD domain-containing protein [Chitinophagaceae bacterium]
MFKKLFILLFFIACSLSGKATVVITDLVPDSVAVLSSSSSSWFPIDFNSDGIEDYNFSWSIGRFGGGTVSCYGPSGNEISEYGTSFAGSPLIRAIDSATLINATHTWASAAAAPQPLIHEAGFGGTEAFVDSGTKYIGVRFMIGTASHYGWIKISFTSSYTLTVMSYGYETIASTGLPAGTPSGLPAPPAPVANFTSATTSTDTKTAVTFNDISLNTPTSWLWTFSPATVTFIGGSSATSRNPQVLFGATGKYTVKLKATNTGGSDSAVKTDYMVVTAVPGPVANFTTSTTSTDTKTALTFRDISSNTPTAWEWTFTPATVIFTGGTSPASQNPMVQFTATGKYTVKLKASNTDGSDSITKNNYITVNVPTGITSYEAGEEMLNIYPNPAHSAVTIQNSVEGIMSLLDITGKTEWSAPVGHGTILLDISSLPKGYYTLRVSGEQGVINRKLIVQ